MAPPAPAYVSLVPIILETAEGLGPLNTELTSLVELLREELFLDLGVRYPEVVLRENAGLNDDGYRIFLDEVPVATSVVKLGMTLVDETPEKLRTRGLECVKAVHPGNQHLAAWVADSAAEALSAEQLTPAEVIVEHLGVVLHRNARRFVRVQAVQDLLDSLALHEPALVRTMVPNVVTLLQLTEILGRLVEEEISIRGLPMILQTLGEIAPSGHGTMRMTEEVRAAMKAYVGHRFAFKGHTLVVFLLDPTIEETIRRSLVNNPDGTVHLSLEPDAAQDIVQAVRKEVELRPARAPRPVFLASADIRRFVRKLLEHEFDPPFAVLSYAELPSDLNIEPVSRVSIP